MRKTAILPMLLCSFLFLAAALPDAACGQSKLLVLCWHSVKDTITEEDDYSVSRARFIEQLEYLTTHGYRPVSVSQVIRASSGEAKLPEKAVLLSFDDAYRSFYNFVFPVLSRFRYPSMLAVVGSWIEEGAPKGLPEPLMTWEEIAAVSSSGLVEVASHTYNLHRAVRYNPPGNVGAAISVRQFLAAENRYETVTEYREKLALDFRRQRQIFENRLGTLPRVTVWPYGRCNNISISLAKENSSLLSFNLNDGLAQLDDPMQLSRMLVTNVPIQDFIYQLKHLNPPPDGIRAMQVDLDLIYDPASYEKTDHNLGLLIERLVALDVNTVFLQAFHDAAGTGNIGSVYFHNRVLPVEEDIFSHAVHQMSIRGFQVYAWMPTLSIVLPDAALNQRYRVREYAEGKVRTSTSWYHRLTPFSDEVQKRLCMLYEDLAFGSQINGILFQDDAYLTDREDFHPLAWNQFQKAVGRSLTMDEITKDVDLQRQWTHFKTRKLIDFTGELQKSVIKFRPQARFARNLYANVLIDPRSQTWFAQNYDDFHNAYDHVVVMAYPQLEKAGQPVAWIKALAAKAAASPTFSEKTIFKLQTYDWHTNAWVDDSLLLKEMRTALAAGVRHLAYYPDNLWHDRPDLGTIMLEMSTRTNPEVK